VSSTTYADAFDPNVLMDACLKEKNIQVCRDLAALKDGGEKFGVNTLKSWHMLDFATVVGTAAKIGIEKKIAITDKTDLWFIPGHERSIEISEHQTMLVLKWPLPW
jgi:hypothetical protein